MSAYAAILAALQDDTQLVGSLKWRLKWLR